MKILEKYTVIAEGVPIGIRIVRDKKEYVDRYIALYYDIGDATRAILDEIRDEVIEELKISPEEVVSPERLAKVKSLFREKVKEKVNKEFPELSESARETLSGLLLHEMIGLGVLEPLLADDDLEEIVINTSKEPIWVYHKKYGWLLTNVRVRDEKETYHYAERIARLVGREITILNPLMDAHLLTGDRVNATLFPISTKGNTMTIRKFRRRPWTMIDFIDPKLNTISSEAAAFVWTCIEYELNILVAGGTGSGKTSMLNAMLAFVHPNHRIVSIEDTRELNLPKYLHWVPLVTRLPNPEGKGEVSMLDLLINALRMRPDRIVVGEVRRGKEAEVLFEAMHTGHSVYATLHADRAEQVIRRLTSPPINLPGMMITPLHLTVVQFRHRKLGIRRTWQIAEFIPTTRAGEETLEINLLYRWKPVQDRIEMVNDSVRVREEIELHAGLTYQEIKEEIEEKKKVLEWMLRHGVRDVNSVGLIVAHYYRNKDRILELVEKDKKPKDLLGLK